MRFVYDHEGIAGQIIEQSRRRLARIFPGQVPRIVFDAATEAHLFHHLHVEHRALMQPLGFNQLALFD